MPVDVSDPRDTASHRQAVRALIVMAVPLVSLCPVPPEATDGA